MYLRSSFSSHAERPPCLFLLGETSYFSIKRFFRSNLIEFEQKFVIWMKFWRPNIFYFMFWSLKKITFSIRACRWRQIVRGRNGLNLSPHFQTPYLDIFFVKMYKIWTKIQKMLVQIRFLFLKFVPRCRHRGWWRRTGWPSEWPRQSWTTCFWKKCLS